MPPTHCGGPPPPVRPPPTHPTPPPPVPTHPLSLPRCWPSWMNPSRCTRQSCCRTALPSSGGARAASRGMPPRGRGGGALQAPRGPEAPLLGCPRPDSSPAASASTAPLRCPMPLGCRDVAVHVSNPLSLVLQQHLFPALLHCPPAGTWLSSWTRSARARLPSTTPPAPWSTRRHVPPCSVAGLLALPQVAGPAVALRSGPRSPRQRSKPTFPCAPSPAPFLLPLADAGRHHDGAAAIHQPPHPGALLPPAGRAQGQGWAARPCPRPCVRPSARPSPSTPCASA